VSENSSVGVGSRAGTDTEPGTGPGTGPGTRPDTGPVGPSGLVSQWATVPEVALALGVDVVKVRQMLREHQLVALRRDGVLMVPALLVHDGRVLKGLPGLLTVLSDNRYTDEETVNWLFTTDDSLPGRPVDALRENRGTEVRRRAQALAF
jgi:hypothetical protein